MNLSFKALIISLFLTSSLLSESINIAVAANVSYAIVDIKKAFEKLYPKTKVKIILGSSGKLTAQIKHGAPFDIFMSANMKYPNALFKEGLALSKAQVYAEGGLAFLSTKKQDFSSGLHLVLDKDIKKIAIANPKTAPYGIASYEALKNANLLEQLKSKFVYGESISQTLSFTIAAADIGFVAKSLLYSSKMKKYKEGENWAEVDSSLFTPIEQGIVVLEHGKDTLAVKRFYEFVLSAEAKKIFSRFGYVSL